MKDPLDPRNDAYQQLNDEAQRQGKPVRATLESKPRDIKLNSFGPLRGRAKDPAALLDALDRLTKVDQRLAEDICFYWVGESAELDGPLPEPFWDPNQQVPLPEVPIEADFVRAVTGAESRFLAPIEFRSIAISPLRKYDEPYSPVLEVIFDR